MCVDNKTILFCYAGSSSAGYSAYGEQTPYGVGAGGGGSSYESGCAMLETPAPIRTLKVKQYWAKTVQT